MTLIAKLQSYLDKEYESEDGDKYKIELLDGLTNDELIDFKNLLPSKSLPKNIEELLQFTKGFEFYGLEEVRFDALNHFGFEEMFPNSIQLAGDGFGNFWILDIDSNGSWGKVYYVCHDPAVIVLHSQNLEEFIEHVNDYGVNCEKSHLDIIHEKTVFEIWQEKVGIMEKNETDYDFETSEIEFPEMYLIADLENAENGTGFSWGKFGPRVKIIRPDDRPIWIIEKKVKQGFLARLFNRQG